MGGGNKRPIGIEGRKPFIHNPNSKKTEAILQSPNEGLCKECTDVIEWRKKYRKYKPLTVPGKCSHCLQRKVTRAYHELCEGCAKTLQICAKCHKGKEIVAEMTDPKDKERDQIKLRNALYLMTESDRRTFYRELEKAEELLPKKKGDKTKTATKKTTTTNKEEEDDEDEASLEEDDEEGDDVDDEDGVKKITKATAKVSIFNNEKVKEIINQSKLQQQQKQQPQPTIDEKEIQEGEEMYKAVMKQQSEQQGKQVEGEEDSEDYDDDEEGEEFDDEEFDEEDDE